MSDSEHAPLISSFSILISDLLKAYSSCAAFIKLNKYVCKVFNITKKAVALDISVTGEL